MENKNFNVNNTNKKKYVNDNLSDFLNENRSSYTLKRKYRERPAVIINPNAPLRNQVLSFVAESGTISKTELKKFILGLKEGGSTPAAANMFIKRNAKYFVTESKNGITYFKLSNIGQRLVNQFAPQEETSLSESNYRRRLNEKDEEAEFDEDDELKDEDLDDIPVDGEDMDDMDIDDEDSIGNKGDDDDEDFEDEDDNEFNLEGDDEPEEEEDLAAKVAELEARIEELEAELENQGGDTDDEIEVPVDDDDELVLQRNGGGDEDESEEHEENETPEEEAQEQEEGDDDDEVVDEDEDEDFEPAKASTKFNKRKYDFKDKGRPGLVDIDESVDESLSESRRERLEQIIENIKAKRSKFLNEVDEVDPNDELKDDDLDQVDDVEATDDGGEQVPEEQEVEKVEITEFILTVDNVEEAIQELEELGISAERVPVEAPEQEVPAETDEEPTDKPTEDTENTEEKPAEGGDNLNLDLGLEDNKAAKESLQAFLNQTYLNEADKEENASDELGLGDQGTDAKALEDPEQSTEEPTEEPIEATKEFEENKIKVLASDWDILKGWLTDKGVDIKEMFGGDIETEEIDPNAEAAGIGDKGSSSEISDDDIDFSGIGEKDESVIKTETKSEK